MGWRSQGWWLLLGMLAVPTGMSAQAAQTLRAADLVGEWSGDVEIIGNRPGAWFWWMKLGADGQWHYGSRESPFTYAGVGFDHGGARWRLVGDTLWLGNDFYDYYGGSFRHIESDSLYWSATYRDTTTNCAGGGGPCPTWVYHVTMQDQQLHLVMLENLSRQPQGGPLTATLVRDSLATGPNGQHGMECEQRWRNRSFCLETRVQKRAP